jgi:hypothetical protein
MLLERPDNDTRVEETDFTRALAAHRAARIAIDMISAIEDLPDGPVYDAAVSADQLAQVRCTEKEMFEKCVYLTELCRDDRADFDILAEAVEAWTEQRDEEMALALKQRQAA